MVSRKSGENVGDTLMKLFFCALIAIRKSWHRLSGSLGIQNFEERRMRPTELKKFDQHPNISAKHVDGGLN